MSTAPDRAAAAVRRLPAREGRMRILFLAHRLPYPPDKGEKIRAFNQIVRLARSHDVHLVCFADGDQEMERAVALRRWCVTVDAVRRSAVLAWGRALLYLAAGRPMSLGYFASPRLAARVRGLCRRHRFDCVVVFSSTMAQYLWGLPSCPTVMDLVDVDSDKWAQYAARTGGLRSWVYGREARRLGLYEARIVRRCDVTVVVSEAERRLLLTRVPDARCVAISNGVDLEYFRPVGKASCGPVMVFTGAMDYYPNVDAAVYFAEEVLPEVRRVQADAEFWVVGSNPTAEVSRLADRPGVRVTGRVPDVRPYLAAARVFVAPLRIARGLQNKVLEALAAGVPVVATAMACEGLGDGARRAVTTAEGVDAFAGAVLALLSDEPRRTAAVRQGRAYVERCHRWDDQVRRLEDLLRRVVGEATCRAARGR